MRKTISRIVSFSNLPRYFQRVRSLPDSLKKVTGSPYLRDARHNFFVRTNEPHILIMRHENIHTRYNDHFLKWVKQNYPRIFSRFKLERVSRRRPRLNKTALFVPWLQDPLKDIYPDSYANALAWQAECRRLKIPVINPVESLPNSLKSVALNLIRKVGIRTAAVIPIDRPSEFDPQKKGLSFPFFIREDHIHSSAVHFVNTPLELKQVPWSNFQRPVAVEYIDVQSPDGYFRKCRYVMMGERGVPRHLIVSQDWYVHAGNRVHNAKTLEEEKQFVHAAPNPYHPLLNEARKLLGLDFVAFDYSLDPLGNLVVWEPNPLPVFWGPYPPGFLPLQEAVISRLYRNLLIFYLERAGFDHLIQEENLQETGMKMNSIGRKLYDVIPV